ncbi:hypothetical protein [Mycoplasma sp. BRA285]
MKIKSLFKFALPTLAIASVIPISASCTSNTSAKQPMSEYQQRTLQLAKKEKIYRETLAPNLYKIIDSMNDGVNVNNKETFFTRYFTNEELQYQDSDTPFERDLKTLYLNANKFFSHPPQYKEYDESNFRVQYDNLENKEAKNPNVYLDKSTLTTENSFYIEIYNLINEYQEQLKINIYDYYNITDSDKPKIEDKQNYLHNSYTLKQDFIKVINKYFNQTLPSGFQAKLYDIRFNWDKYGNIILNITQDITYQNQKLPKSLSQHMKFSFNTLLSPQALLDNIGLFSVEPRDIFYDNDKPFNVYEDDDDKKLLIKFMNDRKYAEINLDENNQLISTEVPNGSTYDISDDLEIDKE